MENLTLIKDEDRKDFLPRHFGFKNDFVVFESGLYTLMEMNSTEYKGGYWQFYETDSGAPILLLNKKGTFEVVSKSNFFQGSMDIGVYSAATTTLVTNLMSARAHERGDEEATDQYAAYYFLQMDWARRSLSKDDLLSFEAFLD